MKEPLKLVAVAVVLCGLVVFGALNAFAADEAKCTLPVSVNTAISTTQCQQIIGAGQTIADGGAYGGDGGVWTGAGSPRNAAGVVATLQCNVDVYYDPTATAGGVATSADHFVEFTNNKDTAYIYLKPSQIDISLLAMTADGGCTVGVSDRAKPR